MQKAVRYLNKDGGPLALLEVIQTEKHNIWSFKISYRPRLVYVGQLEIKLNFLLNQLDQTGTYLCFKIKIV